MDRLVWQDMSSRSTRWVTRNRRVRLGWLYLIFADLLVLLSVGIIFEDGIEMWLGTNVLVFIIMLFMRAIDYLTG